jgi:hypothetical protein
VMMTEVKGDGVREGLLEFEGAQGSEDDGEDEDLCIVDENDEVRPCPIKSAR